MPRKKRLFKRPSLKTLLGSPVAMSAGDNGAQIVEIALKEAALALQQNGDVPFYTVRDAAAYFKVSLKTVHRAYQSLCEDGYLRMVRGSGTHVIGRAEGSTRMVRGVVGIPVWLPGFLTSPTGRVLVRQLEVELRRRHYAADLIFYTDEEEHGVDLARLILQHEPDLIYWHAAPAWVRDVVLRIEDAGVKVILLSDGKAFQDSAAYRMDMEGALQRAMRDWYEGGIRRVLLPSTRSHLDQFARLLAIRTLKSLEMEVLELEAPMGHFPDLLQSGSRTDEGVILLSSQYASSLCVEYADDLVQMMNHRRVLLFNGELAHPLLDRKRPEADVIDFDFHALAVRIATDIGSKRVPFSKSPIVIKPLYRPQQKLGYESKAPRRYVITVLE